MSAAMRAGLYLMATFMGYSTGIELIFTGAQDEGTLFAAAGMTLVSGIMSTIIHHNQCEHEVELAEDRQRHELKVLELARRNDDA